MTPIPPSTGLFYGRSKSQMNTLTAQADRLQTQIATTKKYQAPSDNSIAYQRLQRLQRQGADADAFDANLDMAASLLQQTDTTLQAIETQVQRASELVVRARTGTMDAGARKAIAAELTEIVGALVDLANTADTRGQPLLGGVDGAAAVARGANNSFTYSQGTPAAVPVGDEQSVQATESAARVFDLGGGRDTLAVLAALAARIGTGEALTEAEGAAGLDDLSAASEQVTAVRGTVGARAARVDLLQAQSTAIATDRETERSAIEDTDMAAAIADLQQTMTVLSATQASFSKLSQLSLFDYLR